MVFGAICSHGPVVFVTDTGTINSETYCTICDQLVPAANAFFPQGWILQQDNAPAHTANDTNNVSTRRPMDAQEERERSARDERHPETVCVQSESSPFI